MCGEVEPLESRLIIISQAISDGDLCWVRENLAYWSCESFWYTQFCVHRIYFEVGVFSGKLNTMLHSLHNNLSYFCGECCQIVEYVGNLVFIRFSYSVYYGNFTLPIRFIMCFNCSNFLRVKVDKSACWGWRETTETSFLSKRDDYDANRKVLKHILSRKCCSYTLHDLRT